jgi:hypothetical protein
MSPKSTMRWVVFVGLAGLGCFVLAYTQFSALSELEAKGGSIRLHSVEALLYRNFGKFGVLGFYGLGGILCLGGAAALYRKRSQL